MAKLPDTDTPDPTLEAVDREIEARQSRSRRPYLGMSAIGAECERQLWYGFRWVSRPAFDALSLKRFEDGHKQEDIQAFRLRLVPGIELFTVDPESGNQFGFTDFGGHFRGHMDGAIRGLIQAPKTWHCWEHKATAPTKQNKLAKLKRELGEKTALSKWDPVYWAQGILYMDYSGMTRHYLTCSDAGGRNTISVRTDADPAAAIALKAKAKRIIFADTAPPRVGPGTPDFYLCRWCDHAALCYGDAMPEANCRTCAHVTPREDGSWWCVRHGEERDKTQQEAGCPAHLFNPDMIPGEAIDADPNGHWVKYRLRSGAEWTDEA